MLSTTNNHSVIGSITDFFEIGGQAFCLSRLDREKTYKPWAEAMGVTNNTLEKHVESIYGKTADSFALENVKKATPLRIFATYRW